jgi:hypothetical protein
MTSWDLRFWEKCPRKEIFKQADLIPTRIDYHIVCSRGDQIGEVSSCVRVGVGKKEDRFHLLIIVLVLFDPWLGT